MFFACVSFQFVVFLKKSSLHSGRSKVTRATVGRDTKQSFRVCKVKLAESEKTTSQTTFTSEKGTVTTGTHESTTGTHTEKSKGFSTLSTSESGNKHLENSTTQSGAGQTIQTDYLTVNLNPFPFSLHLSLPTFTFPFFGFLAPPLSFLFLTSVLPQPTAGKVFFAHGLVFPEQVLVFSGQGSSVFQHFQFGDVSQPFSRHETLPPQTFPEAFCFPAW